MCISLCVCFSIELQVQEQPSEVRSAVYSHLEAFVPCNKEALLKRLKKLSLNIQVCGSLTACQTLRCALLSSFGRILDVLENPSHVHFVTYKICPSKTAEEFSFCRW